MFEFIDKLAFNLAIIKPKNADADEFTVIKGNRALTQLLDHEPEGLAGKPLHLIFKAEKSDSEQFSLTGRLIKKHGETVPVTVFWSTLSDCAGLGDCRLLFFQPLPRSAIVSMENEQRHLRQVQLALTESLERFRQMAEMTGEWLWEQDEQGFYTYSSAAVKQILGYPKEAVVGKHYTELLTEKAKIQQQYYAASRRPFYTLINRYRHRDGHEVLTESTGLPLVDENGKIIKWRGADHDITAQKHFQDALIESEQRVRLILESSLSAIVIMDAYGLVIDWNRRAEKLFGWSKEEALGRGLDQLIIPERYRAAHRAGLEKFLKTGAGLALNRQFEMTALRRSGAEFPVEVNVSPLKLDNTYIFSGFIHDITERKATEKRMREAQINLAVHLNEIKIAQQIQATLLPSEALETEAFEIVGCCLPADRVGGDYFDYFFRGDSLLDFVIADVSGHAVGPSLFMMEARSAIRTQASRPGTPAETLRTLNDFLYPDLTSSDFFISMFYLQYDLETGALHYANAGHPPPLLIRADGEKIRELDTDGLILGVREHERFEQKTLPLASGDLVVLYTDGLTEAENIAGDFFGLERVKNLLADCADQPLQAIIDRLLDALKSFCQGDRFNDDVTLLIFKVR